MFFVSYFTCFFFLLKSDQRRLQGLKFRNLKVVPVAWGVADSPISLGTAGIRVPVMLHSASLLYQSLPITARISQHVPRQWAWADGNRENMAFPQQTVQIPTAAVCLLPSLWCPT